MKYGLQLYSVRDSAAENFEEMLASVAKMGYSFVESAGFYDRTAEQVKKSFLSRQSCLVCGKRIQLFRNASVYLIEGCRGKAESKGTHNVLKVLLSPKKTVAVTENNVGAFSVTVYRYAANPGFFISEEFYQTVLIRQRDSVYYDTHKDTAGHRGTQV